MPFTTIAWRLWHVIDMYGEDRAPQWLDVPAQGPPVGLDDPAGAPPATAADALELLERAHDRWDAHLALADEDRLRQLIGLVGGPTYAERTRAAYVLHMLDEFIRAGSTPWPTIPSSNGSCEATRACSTGSAETT